VTTPIELTIGAVVPVFWVRGSRYSARLGSSQDDRPRDPPLGGQLIECASVKVWRVDFLLFSAWFLRCMVSSALSWLFFPPSAACCLLSLLVVDLRTTKIWALVGPVTTPHLRMRVVWLRVPAFAFCFVGVCPLCPFLSVLACWNVGGDQGVRDHPLRRLLVAVPRFLPSCPLASCNCCLPLGRWYIAKRP
jgi:hypothetical protein